MSNEFLFVLQASLIGIGLLASLRFSKEALITFIAIQAIAANIFVVKQISFFGLNATAADTYAIGCMLGFNLLQEYYGKETTRFAVIISFFVAIFFTLCSQIHLWYIPSSSDVTHDAFVRILAPNLRIVAASLSTYFIVQLFDMQLYALLKAHFNNRFYILRNWSSVALSQLLDTLLFSFLGLYGIVSHLWSIIIVSYTIKLAVLLLSTPFLLLARRVMQQTRT